MPIPTRAVERKLTELNHILVATDLSAPEECVLQRGCEIAAARGASMKLMYLPAPGAAAEPGAAARLDAAAKRLEQRFAIGVQALPVKKEARFGDLESRARGMDLVVLPHRRERSTAAFFRGQPVLRLLRSAGSPVLVARRCGEAPYRRVLVAVDLSPGAAALVQFADRLAAEAQLEIFHALPTQGEARLRAAEASELAVRAYRDSLRRRAEAQMLTLRDSFSARRNRVMTMTGRGDAGHQVVVQQERSGADLVVVGKRRSSAWGDFLGGSVAHRVLSWGSSDVLIVPDAYLQRALTPAGGHRQGAPAPAALALLAGGRPT